MEFCIAGFNQYLLTNANNSGHSAGQGMLQVPYENEHIL